MIETKMGSATRDAYGKALVELGRENPDIIVLDADLSKSTRTDEFGKACSPGFPNGSRVDAGMGFSRAK